MHNAFFSFFQKSKNSFHFFLLGKYIEPTLVIKTFQVYRNLTDQKMENVKHKPKDGAFRIFFILLLLT